MNQAPCRAHACPRRHERASRARGANVRDDADATPSPQHILFSRSQDQQEKEAKAKAAAGAAGPKQSPGEIRLAKDISELTLAPTMSIEFPTARIS